MDILLIGDAFSSHIKIEVLGYERNPSENSYDSNWLTCNVSVSCGAWTGNKFPVSLQTNDFSKLLEGVLKLNISLKGESSFSTIEEQLEFIMIGNGLGKFEIQGQAMSSHAPPCALKFNFEIDQTYLTKIIAQLNQITSKFPVR